MLRTRHRPKAMRRLHHYLERQKFESSFFDVEFYKRDACHPGESPGLSAHPLGANSGTAYGKLQRATSRLTEVPTAPRWVAEGGHWDSGMRR